MNQENLYQLMLLIREFEDRAHDLYKAGHIGGFCHLYTGQEAIAVGLRMVMQKNDYMITTYRNHGHALMAGIEPKQVMAELTGRSGGCARGKGGSMHMFSEKHKFIGGFGIVGTTASIGTGTAFAQKYNGTSDISIALYGDGAANQGQVYESYNLATIYDLPILFVIEDNRYAISVSKANSCGGKEHYQKAEGWNIPSKCVDGQDIDEVLKAAAWGMDYVRTHSKPALLQFKTYRFKGHSCSDSTRLYRTREEEELESQRDCLRILATRIGLTQDKIDKMIATVKTEIQIAVDFALTSPFPDLSELTTDVYR